MSEPVFKQFNFARDVIIDVRSEKEFAKGHFPSAVNIPLLNNEHRHLVGICFKKQGQVEAVKLGHQLVDPIKNQLQHQWSEVAKGKNLYVY